MCTARVGRHVTAKGTIDSARQRTPVVKGVCIGAAGDCGLVGEG